MISSIHKLIHGCNCTLSLKTFSLPSSISRIGEQEPNQLDVQHVNKMINFCDVWTSGMIIRLKKGLVDLKTTQQ